jgi:transcriptional regulator with PAS, ATPase and Fis domain
VPTFIDLTHTLADPRFSRVSLRAAQLVVVSGPDAGTSIHVDGPTLTIGSGADAGLRLSDTSVSREHFRLELRPNGILVCDGGSKNGTWLGGVRVERITTASDIELTLGGTVLRLVLDREPSTVTITEATRFGRALGSSTAMRHLFAYLEKASESDVPLLLEGENGVGKEVLALSVHERSRRAEGPFVVVDCGAIAPQLIESELFGHEKGAFTGAERARAGLFVEAQGGTLFLDELGELPIELQPKLLRALEAREIRPVGSNRARKIDFRLIAATNRSLVDRIKSGAFREDLYYRLAVAKVRVPPLREREDDIVELANTFLTTFHPGTVPEVPADVAAMFKTYAWPGNVRELRNAVARFALLGSRERSDLLALSEGGAGGIDEALSHMRYHDARLQTIERFEQLYFQTLLDRLGGNISKAADFAGVARSTYYRMLERSQGKLPPDADE